MPWATRPLTIASPPVMVVIVSFQLCSRSFVGHAVAQDAHALGFDLDHVAGLEVARWIKPRAGAGRCARDDDVAGYERGEGRDVVDEVAEQEDQPRGVVVLPRLAIDARGQPDIGNLGLARIGHDPWPEAAGRIEVLALRDVEFRVAHPVANGALVAKRDRCDVIERLTFPDVT